jgi:hypothetical protein
MPWTLICTSALKAKKTSKAAPKPAAKAGRKWKAAPVEDEHSRCQEG